jgi:hypothetical protein
MAGGEINKGEEAYGKKDIGTVGKPEKRRKFRPAM